MFAGLIFDYHIHFKQHQFKKSGSMYDTTHDKNRITGLLKSQPKANRLRGQWKINTNGVLNLPFIIICKRDSGVYMNANTSI
jgi:hypothetical protein